MKKISLFVVSLLFSLVGLADNPQTIQMGGTSATTAPQALINLGAAADSAVVHKIGNETVSGIKTFNGSNVIIGDGTTTSTLQFINSGNFGIINFYSFDTGELFGRMLVGSASDPTDGAMTFSLKDGGGFTDYLKLDGAAQTVNVLKPLNLTYQLDASYLKISLDDFYVDGSGKLRTIQPIGTADSPTFYGLTLDQGALSIFDPLGGTSAPIGFVSANSVDNLGNLTTYAYTYAVIDNDTPGSIRGSLHIVANIGNTFPDFFVADGTTGTNQMVKPARLMTESASGPVYTDSNKDLRAASVQTYTPTIGDGTNNFTTSTATGKYEVVGNRVEYYIYIVWTSKGSASGAQNVKISLPSTIGASSPRITAGMAYMSGISWTGNQLTCGGQTGDAYLNCFGIANNAAGSPVFVTISQMGTSGQVQFSGSYYNN